MNELDESRGEELRKKHKMEPGETASQRLATQRTINNLVYLVKLQLKDLLIQVRLKRKMLIKNYLDKLGLVWKKRISLMKDLEFYQEKK